MNKGRLDQLTVPRTFSVTVGDLNIYHARLIADQQITYVVEFSDILDIEQIKRSLALLNAALPILSAVIEVRGSRFRWVQQPGREPAFRVELDCEDPQPEIVRFISCPCNPEREPLLKLLVLRCRGRDTLCFKIDHVLSDAAGLKFLLYLFAGAYSTGQIIQPINADRGFGQVFRCFSPIALLKAAAQASVPVPGPALITGPFRSEPLFIERACLVDEEFEQLRAASKLWGVTINDVLLAALYRAVFQWLNPNDAVRYPMMVPIDMRRYLPEAKRGVIANLSSAVYPRLTVTANETSGDTLTGVKASMDELKQNQSGLGPMLLMAIGGMLGGRLLRQRYQQAASRGSRFINFTNFGIIDETQLAFDGVSIDQAYGVGPNQYAPGILIALSTYRKTLHLVVQGNDTERFQPFIRSFLDAVLVDLRLRRQ
jgi:NRPS condensation-like uncharacterized protein